MALCFLLQKEKKELEYLLKEKQLNSLQSLSQIPLKNDGYSFRSSDLKKLALLEIPLEDPLVNFLFSKDIDDIKYFIFVNSNSPLARKRFTIAHELGHIFLGRFKESYLLFFK